MSYSFKSRKSGGKIAYFFGDSFTYGSGGTTTANSWPSIVSTFFGYRCVNYAVPGQTVTQGTDNPVSTTTIPTKAVGDHKLFMCWGLNDSFKTVGGNPITTTMFETDYQAFINAAIAKGWAVSDMFILNGYLTKTGFNINYPPFRTSSVTIATNNGIDWTDIYTYMLNNGDQALLHQSGPNDNHPNDLGYSVIAAGVELGLTLN